VSKIVNSNFLSCYHFVTKGLTVRESPCEIIQNVCFLDINRLKYPQIKIKKIKKKTKIEHKQKRKKKEKRKRKKKNKKEEVPVPSLKVAKPSSNS
jgi:hypothetical protein